MCVCAFTHPAVSWISHLYQLFYAVIDDNTRVTLYTSLPISFFFFPRYSPYTGSALKLTDVQAANSSKNCHPPSSDLFA